MNLVDCLVMLLLNSAICICLPRVLMLLQSNASTANSGFSGENGDQTALQ